jgi:hypothetical protein
VGKWKNPKNKLYILPRKAQGENPHLIKKEIKD